MRRLRLRPPIRTPSFRVRLPRSSNLSPPAPNPWEPGQDSTTHVLLHFSQVLLGEGQRGGLHGEAGDGTSSGSGSSGCTAPPKLGASASGGGARSRGGARPEEERYPFENRGARAQTAALPALPLGRTVQTYVSRRGPQYPNSFPILQVQATVPSLGEAGPRAEPAPSLRQPTSASPRANPSRPFGWGLSGVAPPTASGLLHAAR